MPDPWWNYYGYGGGWF